MEAATGTTKSNRFLLNHSPGVPDMGKDEENFIFVIADLSGYSALTEVHGGKSAAEVAARYIEIVHEALDSNTNLVERVGDEVLLVSSNAAAAVKTAIKLHIAIDSELLFPSVHIGIHAGKAYLQKKRYYGTALNLTARITAHAREGQILCSHRLDELAGNLPGVEYRALGSVQFKNIAQPVAVFQILNRDHDCASSRIDPVCRMQVRPGSIPSRLNVAGKIYYFCSLECAQIFIEQPERYMT